MTTLNPNDGLNRGARYMKDQRRLKILAENDVAYRRNCLDCGKNFLGERDQNTCPRCTRNYVTNCVEHNNEEIKK